MRDSTYRFNLDIHDIASQVQITAKQNDNARKIIANLMEHGKPYRIDRFCRAVMMIKKPDGTILYNDCEIIDKGSAVSYDFTTQTTASVGINRCELRIYGDNNKIISSPRFTMLVCLNVYQDGQVSSTSEYTALTEAMSDIAEFEETVTDAVERVDEAVIQIGEEAERINAALDRETQVLNRATDVLNDANNYSNQAKAYRDASQGYSVQSQGYMNASQGYSNDSYGHEVNAKGYKDQALYYSNKAEDAIDEISRRLGIADFSVDDDGNLIYTDDTAYVFGVNDNGELTWEVADE